MPKGGIHSISEGHWALQSLLSTLHYRSQGAGDHTVYKVEVDVQTMNDDIPALGNLVGGSSSSVGSDSSGLSEVKRGGKPSPRTKLEFEDTSDNEASSKPSTTDIIEAMSPDDLPPTLGNIISNLMLRLSWCQTSAIWYTRIRAGGWEVADDIVW